MTAREASRSAFEFMTARELGQRRRHRRWICAALAAAAVGGLGIGVWGFLLLFVASVVFVVGALLPVPNWMQRAPRASALPPTSTPEDAPEELVERIEELALIHSELLAARGDPDLALMLRLGDWLGRVEDLPEEASAWFRERGADYRAIRSQRDRWLAADDPRECASEAWALGRVIARFELAIAGLPTGDEPEGKVRGGRAVARPRTRAIVRALTVAIIVAWCGAAWYCAELFGRLSLEPFEAFLVFGLGPLPLLVATLAAVREGTGWLLLSGATRRSRGEVDRAAVLATLDNFANVVLLAALLLTGLGLIVGALFDNIDYHGYPSLYIHYHVDDEAITLAALAPSLVVVGFATLRWVLSTIELEWLRWRADRLLALGSGEAWEGPEIFELLTAVIVLGPRLRRVSIAEQADELEAIAGQLLSARKLPPELRAKLREAEFQPAEVYASVRVALERGGALSRRELFSLRIQLRELERSLWRAARA